MTYCLFFCDRRTAVGAVTVKRQRSRSVGRSRSKRGAKQERARFDLGLDLSNDTIQDTGIAGECRMSGFQENPVLDANRVRQIKRHLTRLVHAFGCGTIAAHLLTVCPEI